MDQILTKQTATGSVFGGACMTLIMVPLNAVAARFMEAGADALFTTAETNSIIAAGGVVIGALVGRYAK